MRDRFVAAVRQAVEKQAKIAAECDGALLLTGEVIDAESLLVIPHELASPVNPDAVIEGPRPDIYFLWWLAKATVSALRAAGEARLVHGGIQLGSVVLDAVGRVKLTDFGLAPAFELIGDSDTLGKIMCDARISTGENGEIATSTWSLAGDESREYGWIAPYFAHEVLSGARLNSASDQFALGTLLYAWATGVMPFGQEFSDPSIFAHFQIEPTEFEDQREDWAPYFERASKGESLTADESVVEWAKLVLRLLARLSSDRFNNLAAAEECVNKYALPAWTQAAQALRDAGPLLDEHQYDDYLNLLGPWLDNASLPQPQRDRLHAQVQAVEAQRKTADAQRAFVERLREAEQAKKDGNAVEAARIAREVADEEQAPEKVRDKARQLVATCESALREAEQRARKTADDTLQRARAALQALNFDDARRYALEVNQTAAAPVDLRGQATALLAEIDTTAKRQEQLGGLIDGARDDLRAGLFDAARRRLEQLTADPDAPDALRNAAAELTGEIDTAEANYNEAARMLDECAAALESGDVDAALQRIDECPSDALQEDLAARRGDLAARCARLREIRETLHTLDLKLVEGRADEALAACEELLAESDLPIQLRDELAALGERCRQALEEEAEARLERMRKALDDARTHWERGAPAACRELLLAVQREPLLPDQERAAADALLNSCAALERAVAAQREAEELLAAAQFEPAQTALDAVEFGDLPAGVRRELELLQSQIESQQTEHARQRVERFEAALVKIDEQLLVGQIAEASKLCEQIAPPSDAPTEARERFELLRADVAEQAKCDAAVKKIEEHIAARNFADAEKALAKLSKTKAPDWAQARLDVLGAEITAARERRRREQVERTAAALKAAEAALAAGDLADAEAQIAAVGAALTQDEKLGARHKRLLAQADELRSWQPRVETLAQQLQAGDLIQMHPAARKLLDDEQPPATVRKQIEALLGDAEARIRDERKRIDDELRTLSADLESRGRRVRDLPDRTAAIRDNKLATRKQREAAQDVQTKFDELPQPRSPLKPVLIGVAALVVGCVGWFVILPILSSPPNPTRTPQPPAVAVDLIANTLVADAGSATLAYTVSGGAAPPFQVVLYNDKNVNRALDAGEELERSGGDPAPGGHQVTFDLPPGFEGEVGAAFDTTGWPADIREVSRSNNVLFASVAGMGASPDIPEVTPKTFDVAADSFVAEGDAASVTYTVTGESDAPPFDLVLYADRNENQSLDAGEELERVAGDTTAGLHQADFTLPAEFFGALGVLIDTSSWPADAQESSHDNNARFARVDMDERQRTQAMLAQIPPQVGATVALIDLALGHGADRSPVADAFAALGAPETATVEWSSEWTPLSNAGIAAERQATCSLSTASDPLQLRCEIRLAEDQQSWTPNWALADENAFVTLSDWMRATAEVRISQMNADGTWGAARRLHGKVAGVLAAWDVPLNDANLAPAWTALTGYTPPPDWNADEDPIGYPPSLVSDDGQRVLRRVAVTDKDPVWALFEPETQRRAEVFYIEESESAQELDSFDAAEQAARDRGGVVPTREEWMLAALTLGAAAWDDGFFGGKYEWCLDPTDDANPHWVCGGCDIVKELQAPPNPGPPDAALVQWLGHPLVSQPRMHGDGLTTVRAIVRPFAPDAFARLSE